MSQPPTESRPEFEAPSAATCYRHPDRQTGIRCQRCNRPICGECMRPAAVGFQCPSCAGQGQSATRTPRTAFGAPVTASSGPMTKIVLGILAGLFVINLVSSGLVTRQLAMSGLLVADGQYWRLVTYGFTVSGILNMILIGLVIWFAGRPLEQQLGGWRFLALYVLSGFGGATLLYVVGSGTVGSYGGAISAVLGLLAANGVFKQRRGEDIRPDIGLLVLLVALNLVLGWGGLSWVSLVGGAVAGALTGIALVYAPRRRRTMAQGLGMAGVAVLCLVTVAVKTMLGYQMF